MYSEIAKDDQNEIIAGKYQLNRCIGKGAFGLVYRARNILDNKEVAIKLEEIESRYNLLRYEYKVIAWILCVCTVITINLIE